jgi:hypothetical protein
MLGLNTQDCCDFGIDSQSADHSAKSQPHSTRSQPFFLCFSTLIQYHMHTVSPDVETSISSSLWRSPKRSLWGAGPEPVYVNLLRSPEIDFWALKRLQIRAQDSIPWIPCKQFITLYSYLRRTQTDLGPYICAASRM